MQRIIVDITPGFRMPTIYFSQGDVGTQFEIDLRSRFGNTLPASPTVTIQATKPSGFGFSVAATSVTNGVAVFTTTAEMTDEAGRFPAELKVVKDSVSLFSANFYMSGEATTHPEGTIDGQQETVIPELTQLVDRAEEAASSVLDRQTVTTTLAAGSQATYEYDEDTNTQTFGIPQGEAGAGAAGVTASAYSSSSTYAVGDYVIHNSNLYRCTTAITTAEAFNSAHWTQVVLADDVSDLKSDITSINNEDLSIEHIAWADGGISLETGQNTTNSSYWRTESYYKGADYNKFVVDDVESYGFRYSKNNDTYTYVSGFQIIGEYVFDESDTYYYRFSPQKAGFSTSKVQLLYKSKIVEDILALKQLEPKIDELEESATITKTKNLYDASGFANTYLNWSDGTETSFGDARSSAFIEVSEGNTLEYRLTVLGQICPTIACYDSSQNYVQSKSLQALGDGGSWTLQTGTFIIPNGVKYIKFSSCRTTTATDSISINNVETLKEYVLDNIGNQWDGKKWAAFGTSITDTSYTDVHFLQPTGKYVPFLKDMSGMDVTNYGMAGAPILNNIMNKVLTTNLSAFDIVTIEGSVNDHAMSKALGEVGDVGTDTFAGAIYQMAKYVYENSNATLFFITDYVGRYVHINPAPDGSDFYGDCAPTKVNNDGLLQIDYINMMIKQCEYFGIPCITAGQDSGINLLTGNLYLMDHIHSSYVGGKQYAETIWKELKQYQPRVLTV